MAIDILSLLQAASGANSLTNDSGPDIMVQAAGRPRAAPRGGDEAPPSLGNTDWINEILASNKNSQDMSDHRGMFKTKGTLRDILGVLGDAFLVQSGNKAIYAPQRQQEKESDALSGFSDNPIAAIERMSQINPQAAREMMSDYDTQRLRQAQQQSLTDSRQNASSARDFDMAEKGLNRVSRWVRGGMPYEQVLAGASRYRLGPDDLAQLGVTPDMNEEQRRQFSAGDLTTYQQEQIPQRERQMDIAQQNANANTTRANRPPASRPSNPTAASLAAGALRDLEAGKTLTPAQRELLTRTGFSENRGQRKPSILDTLRNKVQQPTSGKAPAAGDVVKGYRFKGGNPADKSNWVKQ